MKGTSEEGTGRDVEGGRAETSGGGIEPGQNSLYVYAFG